MFQLQRIEESYYVVLNVYFSKSIVCDWFNMNSTQYDTIILRCPFVYMYMHFVLICECNCALFII